jgi:hypothetical protein
MVRLTQPQCRGPARASDSESEVTPRQTDAAAAIMIIGLCGHSDGGLARQAPWPPCQWASLRNRRRNIWNPDYLDENGYTAISWHMTAPVRLPLGYVGRVPPLG